MHSYMGMPDFVHLYGGQGSTLHYRQANLAVGLWGSAGEKIVVIRKSALIPIVSVKRRLVSTG